jgi:hypothetical protein
MAVKNSSKNPVGTTSANETKKSDYAQRTESVLATVADLNSHLGAGTLTDDHASRAIALLEPEQRSAAVRFMLALATQMKGGGWTDGDALARDYFSSIGSGADHHKLIDAAESAWVAGSETARGFGETLHKLICERLRGPDTSAPTVQQQLTAAHQAAFEADCVLEGIGNSAAGFGERDEAFFLIEYAAKHGSSLAEKACELIQAVQEHRPESNALARAEVHHA